MAINDYAVGKVTPVADRVNIEAWMSRGQMTMPSISYFIPSYSEDVIIQDSKGASWMKTPWFWELKPEDSRPEDREKYYHDLNAAKVDDIEDIIHIPGES